jgi:hypothetical protein
MRFPAGWLAGSLIKKKASLLLKSECGPKYNGREFTLTGQTPEISCAKVYI